MLIWEFQRAMPAAIFAQSFRPPGRCRRHARWKPGTNANQLVIPRTRWAFDCSAITAGQAFDRIEIRRSRRAPCLDPTMSRTFGDRRRLSQQNVPENCPGVARSGNRPSPRAARILAAARTQVAHRGASTFYSALQWPCPWSVAARNLITACSPAGASEDLAVAMVRASQPGSPLNPS